MKRFLPIAVLLLLAVGICWAAQPAPQIVVPCKVIRVHDGDTVTAEITLRCNVRLLECWVAELSEPKGPAAKAKMQAMANGKTGVLTIPLGDDLGDSLTFGRVLGRITIDGKDLSSEMVKSGFATKEKLNSGLKRK